MSGVVPGARVRRTGVVYLTLLAVGTVGALLVALRIQDPASVLAALLPTWAGAYLAWNAYRADRTEAVVAYGPAEAADRLADAVRRQWEAEAALRLAAPHPLPVAWRDADPAPPEAATSQRLAGQGDEIVDVFTRRVPARRLLVLGEPGSGKTLLLVRLVLALIERRERDHPVPVLFPLASWDPAVLDLRTWMEHRLVQDHPELGAPASDAFGQVTLAAVLLERRLVLPVLDGFDELPPTVGALALHRLNEALPYGCGMVLSSRPAEYRAALQPCGAVPARLAELAAIRLQPLGAEEVATYLRDDAGGPRTAAAERWSAVVDPPGTAGPVAQALTSPLMVGLARSVYNPRPGERHERLPDPGELLRLRTRTAVGHHLLDAFVDAAYRPHPRRPSRWSADRAGPALRFLARYMERGRDGTAELAWWKLRHAVPTALPLMLAGVLLGVVAWSFEGIGMELTHHFTPDGAPVRWDQRGGLGVVAAGICGGLVCGLAAGLAALVLCVLAAAPEVTAQLVLNRVADATTLTLAGVIISGFACGGRPRLRRPADWDRGALLTALVAALCYPAAFGNGCGTAHALLYGVAAAAIRTDGVRADLTSPAARVRWHFSGQGLGRGLQVGLLIGASILLEGLLSDVLSGGDGAQYIAPPQPRAAFWAALQTGTVFGVACVLVHGLRAVPVDLGTSVDGRALLANDRRTLITCVLTATVVGAIGIGIQSWCAVLTGSTRVWGAEAAGGPLWGFVVGIIPAVLTGLAIGIRQSAWGHYTVARCYLALRAGLPYDLMAFLTDAHDRGVLRRVGAVYQFRHIELQHRLAGPPSLSETGDSQGAPQAPR
ncbi:NACHT domain-containing NTPase [Streptomyces sp. TLI_146]|uniref:NACHT domain-containing protein n=1 Tax=Streptomyces sp. TLI_146 TaxID=1938858 RepID=UPI000CC0FB30|nr:NACHT domain-containing protein [Streptomyces sp. TLI_146]PKV89832.1 NACHT domain-containing protein [Streptomyces sp. TLI_146]